MNNLNLKGYIHPLKYSINENNLFIMREDLLPFSFGGNKVRIAMEYFDDMRRKKANCIIGYGSPSSNLNRVIANMAKEKNIPCYIISSSDNSETVGETFNSKLISSLETEIIYCSKSNVANTVEEVMHKCLKKGLVPYYIYGNKFGEGNNIAPLYAYKKVYDYIVEDPINYDYIFLASGTGTTQSGLIIGKLENEETTKIVGISIARDKNKGRNIINNNLVNFFTKESSSFENEIIFEDMYTVDGYGSFNKAIKKSIHELLVSDGIATDPTYTGKAFWGMKQYLLQNNIKQSNILFIHTGGTPLFFDYLLKVKG